MAEALGIHDFIKLEQLVLELKDLAKDWFQYGVLLGIPHNELERIQTENPRDIARCKIEMLNIWLKSNSETSQKQLACNVIKSLCNISHTKLAKALSTKYNIPLEEFLCENSKQLEEDEQTKLQKKSIVENLSAEVEHNVAEGHSSQHYLGSQFPETSSQFETDRASPRAKTGTSSSLLPICNSTAEVKPIVSEGTKTSTSSSPSPICDNASIPSPITAEVTHAVSEGANPSISSSPLSVHDNPEIPTSITVEKTQVNSEDNYERSPSDLRSFELSAPVNISATNNTSVKMHRNATIIFETLGLNDKYKKKFQLKEAQCISRHILELSLQGYCTDAKKLPYLIFHKIMSNDIRCRTNLFKQKIKSNSDQKDSKIIYSSSESEPESDNEDCKINPKELHPVDCLIALLLCCDDLLRRDIFTRLAKCQIAIPLVLPDPFINKYILPLWAMRSVFKEWKMLEGKQQPPMDIISFPMPIVSMIRFGRHQNVGLSKSQILNLLIDGVDSNSYFFHKNCSGGQYKQVLGKGLIDMSWYLRLDPEVYEHPVTFLNLHGDAGQFHTQVKLLTEISSVCLVMICKETHKYTEKDKDLLRSSLAKVIILNATKKKSKDMSIEFPDTEIVKIHKTAPRNYDCIWNHIKMKLNDVTELFSIEHVMKNIHDHNFLLDECSPTHQEGFKRASDIIKNVKESMTNSRRNTLFPLQGKLWKSWAELNKEVHRQKNRGTIDLDEYLIGITSKQDNIRSEQLNLTKTPSPLMELFIESLMNTEKNYELRTYFLRNLILELNRFSAKVLKKNIGLYKNAQLEATQDTFSKSEEKQILEEEIVQTSLGLEHFLREIGQIYEASSNCTEHTEYCSQLAEIVAQLLIDGYPLELMDGDAAHVPLQWVKAVLQQTINKLGQGHKIYVLSVLGLQSTGKSTMLNTVFGLQFNVSAGRCTRGAFMQLLSMDEELKRITKCSYVLIVDTEGLRAIDSDISETQEHDNELATFVIGLANMTIINIYGEVPGDLDDILQTTVHAFLRMNEVELDSGCYFVHQNASPNTKSEIGRNKFTEKLNKFTQNAAKEENCEGKYKYFNDVIKYDDTTDSHFFPGLWKGDPPMAPVNVGYSETAQSLKLHIINSICKISKNASVGLTIASFSKIISSLWEALLKENFVLSFRNTHEISSYNSLEIEYTKWSRKFKQAMIEWEANIDDQISCVDSIELVDFSDKKGTDLTKTVQKHYDEAEMEMNSYFDLNQGIIMKWKETFALKLKNEKTVLQSRANIRLVQLIKVKRAVSIFEAKKNEIVDDFKLSVQKSIDAIKEEQKDLKEALEQKHLTSSQINKLLEKNLFSEDNLKTYAQQGIREEALATIEELMKDHQEFNEHEVNGILFEILCPEEVDIILKQLSHSRIMPEMEFEKIWESLMSKVPELSPTTFDEIARMVQAAVIEHVGPQGRDNKLSDILQMKSLTEYTESDLTFKVTISHFSIPSVYQKMVSTIRTVFNYEVKHFQKVQEITNNIFDSARQYIKQITETKSDFTPTLINELLYFIDDKINGAPKEDFDIQFTHQYRHEIYVRVCGYAIKFFANMSEVFADKNDPRKCLQAEWKTTLQLQYLNQYQQIETEEGVASTLCTYLEEKVKTHVRKRLGGVIIKKMSRIKHYMGNKQALKVQVLTDLLDKDDFSSFMVYITDIRKCLLHHIQKYTMIFCDQNAANSNKSELQEAAVEEVGRIVEVIKVILLKPMKDDITLKDWLTIICQDEEFPKIGVKLEAKDLIAVYDSSLNLDQTNFRKILREKLRELENKVNTSFENINSQQELANWDVKPEEVFKDLIGCSAQCPFCGEQCDYMEHEVDIKHKTEVHRPDCLKGWRVIFSQVMNPKFCPILVSGNVSFKHNTKMYKYQNYKKAYPNWSITPNKTAKSTLYWKWFVNKYSEKIVSTFEAKDIQVPIQWKEIAKQSVIQDLHDVYNI